MHDKTFIFLAGMHRSGTSLLHEVLRGHPDITGFDGTGVPEDEGQHLQQVYPPAKAFGGPGRFAFDERSYMDENHPLATAENAEEVFRQWSRYLDPSCRYVIEKSPPNIVRTRFLQKLFPDSRFIAILRHPLAVAYATRKWTKDPVSSLLAHTFRAYDILMEDKDHLGSLYILRYEDFIAEPQATIDRIFEFLGLPSLTVGHRIRQGVNDGYFAKWERDRRNPIRRLLDRIPAEFEERANRYGYSLADYRVMKPVPWLGAQHTTAG